MPLTSSQPAVAAEHAARPPAVDVARLDALIAEIGDGLPELRAALLADYLADAPKQIATMASAAAAGAGSTVAAAAHQLRSGSALLGATQLAEVLTGVELAARGGDTGLEMLVAPALAEFERVRTELSHLCAPDCPPGPSA